MKNARTRFLHANFAACLTASRLVWALGGKKLGFLHPEPDQSSRLRLITPSPGHLGRVPCPPHGGGGFSEVVKGQDVLSHRFWRYWYDVS